MKKLFYQFIVAFFVCNVLQSPHDELSAAACAADDERRYVDPHVPLPPRVNLTYACGFILQQFFHDNCRLPPDEFKQAFNKVAKYLKTNYKLLYSCSLSAYIEPRDIKRNIARLLDKHGIRVPEDMDVFPLQKIKLDLARFEYEIPYAIRGISDPVLNEQCRQKYFAERIEAAKARDGYLYFSDWIKRFEELDYAYQKAGYTLILHADEDHVSDRTFNQIREAFVNPGPRPEPEPLRKTPRHFMQQSEFEGYEEDPKTAIRYFMDDTAYAVTQMHHFSPEKQARLLELRQEFTKGLLTVNQAKIRSNHFNLYVRR